MYNQPGHWRLTSGPIRRPEAVAERQRDTLLRQLYATVSHDTRQVIECFVSTLIDSSLAKRLILSMVRCA